MVTRSPPTTTTTAHNVSAGRAEGAGPAGVQVGVIQLQQNLDVVVAISLQGMERRLGSARLGPALPGASFPPASLCRKTVPMLSFPQQVIVGLVPWLAQTAHHAIQETKQCPWHRMDSSTHISPRVVLTWSSLPLKTHCCFFSSSAPHGS